MVDCLWKFCPRPSAHYCGCAAAEGNSLRRCGASSLAREPWGRVARVARTDYNLSAEKIFRLHESFNTRLPRGGRVGRVLPAADAVAAKAEGVDFNTCRDRCDAATQKAVLRTVRTVLPSRCAAAEGNSLSLAPAARASSLAREPWGRVAGVARTDYNLSAEKIFRLHESRGTRLPREGAAERLKELPSTLAAFAVLQPTRAFPSAAHCPNPQNILFSGLTFRTIWFVPTTSTSPTSDWNNPTAADFSSVPPSSAR